MASRSSARLLHRRLFRTFFCRRAKKDSIAALSALEATRPLDPTGPAPCKAAT